MRKELIRGVLIKKKGTFLRLLFFSSLINC